MTEDYVSFEAAKLLKEKGFDGECDYFYVNGGIVQSRGGKRNWNKGETLFTDYKNECSAPTLQMAMKWLRKEKGIAIIPIISSILDNEKFLWDIKIVVAKTGETFSQCWTYETPESGYDRAIRYCLENLV